VSTDISDRGKFDFYNKITAWFFQRLRSIWRTAGSGYIKTLKELPGLKEEPVVISLKQIVFVDHGLYI
jgi:hypothetical protein